MKKALIETATKRFWQVALLTFPVVDAFQWLDCADDVAPETHDFDGTIFVLKPPLPAPIDQNDINNLTKAFRAKCISDLAFRLAVAPGALTPAQKQAERDRIKAIADALP